jgi:ribosomal protein L40E
MAILISHNIRIVCDKCGAEHHSDKTTVGVVRREAMELGWGNSRNKDICPKCRLRKPKGWTDERWEQIK